MNFPHEKLDHSAVAEVETAALTAADYQALLAQALARQTSSQSARDYRIARDGVFYEDPRTPAAALDHRMAYFGGKRGASVAPRRSGKLFGTGCFRPDIALRKLQAMDG